MRDPEFFDDATMVQEVPEFMRMRPCSICGGLEVYAVMGPAVSFHGPMPSACEKHVAEARALARGEKVEVQLGG